MRKKWNRMLAILTAAGMVLAVPGGTGTVQAGGFAPNGGAVPGESVITGGQAQDSTEEEKTEEKEKDYAEGEAVILYRSSQAAAKRFQTGASVMSGVEIVDTYDFDAPKGIKAKGGQDSGFKVSLVRSDRYTTTELIQKLKADSSIQYAEPNYKIHVMDTDPYMDYQWALDNQGQNGGTEGFDVKASTLSEPETEDEVVIALVDTGIDYEHEDLKDVVWNNPARSKSFKGYHGYDFINQDEDPMDDNGHGSHCSGIMAASAENGVGISGIDTDENVKIMGLKILDAEGSGYGYEAFGAYNYIYKAQCEGVNVAAINNSWGGGDDEGGIFAELVRLVGENGAVSVCAAGNESSDNDTEYTFPACIDSPYILSVAASNEKDELAAFSNYGKESVELAAPGADILSTVSYDCFNPTIYEDKDALCQKYESFGESEAVQVMDESGYLDAEEISEGNPALKRVEYGLNNDRGTGDVKVELVEAENFGSKEEGGASLKWSITGAKEHDVYMLYLPYDTEASKTALYSSLMVKAQGPEGEGDDFWGLGYSTIEAADAPVDEKGKLDMDSVASLDGAYVNEGNYWTHLSGKTVSALKKAKKRALVLGLSAGADGDYTVYVDDVGVSKPDVESSAFGKYDFYNGTSMATPYVTGAVAAVAARYPEEDALTRKARITGSVRKSDALAEKTITGGVLDLTRIANPGMMVQDISGDDDAVYINGYYLDGARVKVNGKRVNPASSDEYSITIDARDYANEELEITLDRKGEKLTRTYFLAAGSAYTKEGQGVLVIDGGGVVSDGHSIYYIDGSGNVGSAKMEESFDGAGMPVQEDGELLNPDESLSLSGRKLSGNGKQDVSPEEPGTEVPEEVTGIMPDDLDCLEETAGQAVFEMISGGYTLDLFGPDFAYMMDYTITPATDFVFADGGIYVVLDIDTGFSEKSILAFNDLTGWSCVAEVPEKITDLVGYTLAAYNGNCYLMGGLKEELDKCMTTVYRLEWPEGSQPAEEPAEDMPKSDPAGAEPEDISEPQPAGEETSDPSQTEEETEEPADLPQPEWNMIGRLPEGRCFAKAVQVGDKLLITLGGNGSEEVPSNITYDGSKFTVSKAEMGKAYDSETYTWKDSTDKENPEKKMTWYNAMTSLVKGGLIYSGMNVEELGDTFFYHLEEDAFETAGYSLKQTGMSGNTSFAVTAEEKLYVINGDAYVPDDDIWIIFKNGIRTTGKDVDEEEIPDDWEMEPDPSELVDIYSVPVERGTMKVVDDSIEGGFVVGAGYYLPGAQITLVPTAQEGYQVTGFTVDGETVTDEFWRGIAGEAGADIRVAVETELLPDEESGETGKDQSASRTEEAVPGVSATEETKSGNSGTGVTTEQPKTQSSTQGNATTEQPKAQAATQEAATTEQPALSVKPLKKGTVVKKGGLKYKVTSGSAVTCTGVTKKTAKSLTVPNTITVDGVEYKVTAIGAKAFKNCSKLQKLTIATNVKKVGKNLFTGCKKLKKIYVGPKALKAVKKQVKKNKKIVVESLQEPAKS